MKGFLIGFFAFMFASPYAINGDSMEPTFSHEDLVMFESLTYTLEEPVRGDVVVFYGTDEYQKIFVKRIVGMPGESVVIREGDVFIDGEELDESYANKGSDDKFNFREFDGVTYEVPDGKFFMLGDNRKNSFDSRTWNDPFVPRENLVGKYYYALY
ncbi:signal peptidase I [Patescibacteria group bacterium]